VLHRARLLLAAALLAAMPLTAGAQTPATALAGPWTGEIRVAGITLQMRVVFTEGAEGLSAAIDIPQQGAAGIALRNVRREGELVHFELPAGPGLATFDGERAGDRIEGTFAQSGAAGTFVLARGNTPPPSDAPPADLPYSTEEVTFGHGDVRLAGTLTTPAGAGPFPAAVLISGSGAQTRDEEVAGFKVFGTLADVLTRAGIAVLRYDDRGVGQSSGPADVTTAAYAADVLSAVALLEARPGIAPWRIGLIGHSEGALVAAMAAAESDEVGFIVLLAGTTVPGEQVVRGQAEAIVRASGGGDAEIVALRTQQDRLFQVVRSGEGWEALEERARAQGRAQLAAMPPEQRAALGDPDAYLEGVIARQLAGAKSAWYRAFIDYDPVPMLRQVDVPVLGLFGGRDLQVLEAQNRPVLEAQFAGDRARLLTVKTYPEANHLFQSATTGAPAEYPVLAKALVDGLVDDIATWILSLPR